MQVDPVEQRARRCGPGRTGPRRGCRSRRRPGTPAVRRGRGSWRATSWKRAGMRKVPRCRAIVTWPSSSGCRRTSSVRPPELGQLVEEQHAVVGEADLARARGRWPPPTRATSLAVWWGLRKGRRPIASSAGRPAAEWMAAVSSASSSERGRQDARQPAGQHRLARSPAGRRGAGCGRPPRRSRARAGRAPARGRRPGRRPGRRGRRGAAAGARGGQRARAGGATAPRAARPRGTRAGRARATPRGGWRPGRGRPRGPGAAPGGASAGRRRPAGAPRRAPARRRGGREPRRGEANPPSAASRPTAVARSKDEPLFRRLAGARLTVMRRSHLNGMPQLRSAARMRASLSFTAESGSPTIVKRGKPGRRVGLDAHEVGLDAEDGGGQRRGEHGSLLEETAGEGRRRGGAYTASVPGEVRPVSPGASRCGW